MCRRRITIVYLFAVAWLTACGDRPPSPDPTGEGVWEGDGAGAAVPARYLTTFVFAAGESDAAHLYARFANESSPAHLVREYRAWLGDGAGWRSLLAMRDTLPVPRAAWRVLPTPGFRLLVGDGSETLALLFRTSEGELRLSPSAPLAEWTGATGQREYLARATLASGGEAREGLLFFRRAARTPTREAAGGSDRIFLLADPSGAGLLVAQNAGPAGLATAWTWLDDVRGTWSDVEVRQETAEGREARFWVLELPEAGMSGRVWPDEPEGSDAPTGPPAPDADLPEAVVAEFQVNDRVLRLRGLSLRIPLP